MLLIGVLLQRVLIQVANADLIAPWDSTLSPRGLDPPCYGLILAVNALACSRRLHLWSFGFQVRSNLCPTTSMIW